MDCESSDENVCGMNFPVEDDVELKTERREEHKISVPCMERICDSLVPSKLFVSEQTPHICLSVSHIVLGGLLKKLSKTKHRKLAPNRNR